MEACARKSVLVAAMCVLWTGCAAGDAGGAGAGDPSEKADAGPGPTHDDASTPTDAKTTGSTLDVAKPDAPPDGCVDEGCACAPGATVACYSGPSGTAGIGECKAGKRSCALKGEFYEFGACEGSVLPSKELCDGKDHDCNGVVDNGCCSPTTYTLTTGFAYSGISICCKGADKLVSTSDCGDGSDHWVTSTGACGSAFEGSDNHGGPCVTITCSGSICK